ncbi:uncharacterized protein LOC127706525 [Mytilus californianus]|uniref:uncharacterized protein LOC127706525 n=1 Tax=Mytilus californianus TaxID=6549 RepID=UPI0022485503|nr:uncharacterized protein LOC127706525 [Mytilus californianus]
MMAKYLVPLSLLLVILIQKKAYCTDCSSIKNCLERNGNDISNYEFKFDTLHESKNIWGAMCRNTESLTKCLTPAKSGCLELTMPNLMVFSLSFGKATFQQICAKKNGMASLTHCMATTLAGQVQYLQTCLKANNPNDIVISQCGTVQENSITKCIKDYLGGKCSQEAVTFLKSPPGVTCSATNVIGQIVFVICVLIIKNLVA